MRRFLSASLLAIALSACATAPGAQQVTVATRQMPVPPNPVAPPASLSQLVQTVDIPYDPNDPTCNS